MNKVMLMGRVTADPELSKTPTSVSVTRFRIAVERNYKKANGEREADFINVLAWQGLAEFICRYFRKGKPVIITGRLQTKRYDDKEGNKRFVSEVVAESADFLLSDPTVKQNGEVEKHRYSIQEPQCDSFSDSDFQEVNGEDLSV